MSYSEAYLCMVMFLDTLFQKTRNPIKRLAMWYKKKIGFRPNLELNNLGDLLSASDPLLWNPDTEGFYSPIDAHKARDWESSLKSIGLGATESLTSEQVFEGMVAFVSFYKTEFQFDLQDTLDTLNAMKDKPKQHAALWQQWQACVEHSGDYPIKLVRQEPVKELIKKAPSSDNS